MRVFLFNSLLFSSLLFSSQHSHANSSYSYNINSDGTKNSSWQKGTHLDAGFASLSDFFQHLNLGDNKNDNIISEATLKNLYQTVTMQQTTINFSEKYGKRTKKVDSFEDLKSVLTYLESLSTTDNFRFILNTSNTPQHKNIFPVSQGIVTKFKLDNSTQFYNKYVFASDVPIFGHSDLPDAVMIESARLMNAMLANLDSVQASLVKRNLRVDMENQVRDDIPKAPNGKAGGEYNGIRIYVKRSALGLAHELIHAIDFAGFRDVRSVAYNINYINELEVLYNKAVKENRADPTFKGHFVTGMVQSYYNINDKGKDTKSAFKTSLPKEYAFVEKYYLPRPEFNFSTFKSINK